MGAHCAKFCFGDLSNFRRQTSAERQSYLDSNSTQRSRNRCETLRDSDLGVICLRLTVRQLQALLETLKSRDERRSTGPATHVPAHQEESIQLHQDEPVTPVLPATRAPDKVQNQKLQVVGQQTKHNLSTLVKEDFKPYVCVSQNSLP